MLSVGGVDLYYGDAQALSGVSFHVPDGSITAIVGGNGAGKTSLIRAIAGMERVARGTIVFDGTDITGWDSHRVCDLGLAQVAEGRQIFPTMSVLDNLELGAMLPRARKLAARTLDRVWELFPRLLERRQQMAGTLSGGEQQMLAVARAMVTGGQLLLLDEPSMGLAPVLVDEIFDKIIAINKMGTTVLLVEQNASEALEISDFAYVLEVGYSTISGPAKEIASDPRVREAYLGV